MCGTHEPVHDYEYLKHIRVWCNPFLPLSTEVPHMQWWDEMFAPVWDSQPPTVTPELSSDDWAAWHTRTPGHVLSPARVAAVRSTVADLMSTL